MPDSPNTSITDYDHGEGIYRRRVQLNTSEFSIDAQLEDDPHGFKLQLSHDGKNIVDIQVEAIRFPYDSCPAATEKINQLVGLPLSEAENLSAVAKAREHCTHQFDLLQLALDHWRETDTHYQYDIAIPDEINGEKSGSISCNGETLHHWHIADDLITSPEYLQDQPLMRGFYSWVEKMIPAPQRRAAEMLQRGFIVSTSRLVDMEAFADQPVNIDVMPIGACYSLQLGVIEGAHRNKGVTRDFTDNEELLLKFQ